MIETIWEGPRKAKTQWYLLYEEYRTRAKGRDGQNDGGAIVLDSWVSSSHLDQRN